MCKLAVKSVELADIVRELESEAASSDSSDDEEITETVISIAEVRECVRN
jgi:hypothetical protein